MLLMREGSLGGDMDKDCAALQQLHKITEQGQLKWTPTKAGGWYSEIEGCQLIIDPDKSTIRIEFKFMGVRPHKTTIKIDQSSGFAAPDFHSLVNLLSAMFPNPFKTEVHDSDAWDALLDAMTEI